MSAGQNIAGSSHKPAVMWPFTAGFSPTPIIFSFSSYITVGSHKSGSDDVDNDVQIWRSGWRPYTGNLTLYLIDLMNQTSQIFYILVVFGIYSP